MTLENVNIDTITTNVWRNFFDTIKANVITVTIPGAENITIKNWVSSYNDKIVSSKDNYPILIVNSPEFTFENIAYRGAEVTGRIEVEIMTNQSNSADLYLDKMLKAIRDNETTLATYGIEEIIVDDTMNDHYERSGIKVHSRKVVWRFKFNY